MLPSLATACRYDLSGYISAKAGLEGLTRALARELGPADVTANCVAPRLHPPHRRGHGRTTPRP
ncbi:SDR family oxidoreductase [Streptomyces harbinensis]|uniref:SDR family oxidoreductase n=1 Tax=Streptomyces harbinensis TaxID=1176198 RepID=UPI0034DE94F3